MILTLALAAAAAAKPTPPGNRTTVAVGVEKPAERVPTNIRRATVIVRDIETSLKLCRDVMGMKVNYDTVVTTSGVALPAGEPSAKTRLVFA